MIEQKLRGTELRVERRRETRHSTLNSPISQHFGNWSARQELHLRSLRPERSMLLLHHALFAPAWFGRTPGTCFSLEANRSVPGRRLAVRFRKSNGAPGGTCTRTLPADNGLLFYSATRANGLESGQRRKWEREPERLLFAHSLTFPPAHLRELGSGGGSCTHLSEFMRLRSVLWSSSPQISESVGQ